MSTVVYKQHRNERSHPSVGDGFHTIGQMKPCQLILHLLYSLESSPNHAHLGYNYVQLGSGVQEGVSAGILGEDLMTFPTLFYEGSQLFQCFEGLTGNHSSSDSDGNGC